MKSWLAPLLLTPLLLIASTTSGLAQEYASGHGPLEIFDGEAMSAMSMLMKIWIFVLLASFALSIFFVWKKPFARWVLVFFLLMMFAGEPLFDALGLPILGGALALFHLIFWTPVLVLLLVKRPFLDPEEGKWFRIWTGALTLIILISFFFDIQHALVYIEHVQGL